MPDHYFTPTPQSAHKPATIPLRYRGLALAFDTDSGVFSRAGIDRGTLALLDALPDELAGDVLDMGCGYGAIGVTVAARWPGCRVVMSDVNERAASLARDNARRNRAEARVLTGDGYAALGAERFDWILQNPPIRAGKAVIYAMFAEAARRLKPEGQLWLVIRKQQGAPSAKSYLETLFGGVNLADREAGYWVLACSRPITSKEGTEE